MRSSACPRGADALLYFGCEGLLRFHASSQPASSRCSLVHTTSSPPLCAHHRPLPGKILEHAPKSCLVVACDARKAGVSSLCGRGCNGWRLAATTRENEVDPHTRSRGGHQLHAGTPSCAYTSRSRFMRPTGSNTRPVTAHKSRSASARLIQQSR